MDAKVLGEKIAALRKAQGLTQKQLAERLHVTDGAVSKWERGINYPDISMLDHIARILDTDLIILLSLESCTQHQVAQAMTEISRQERADLVRHLRIRTIEKLLIECVIMVAMFTAGRIFSEHGIHGLAQTVTIGMGGFLGALMGSEIYSLRNLPKLK